MHRTAIRLWTLAALTIGVAGFGMLPAHAAPTVADIEVSQCDDGPCTERTALSDGEVATGRVFIESFASSGGGLGLRWVQLEIRQGTSGAWTCVRRWAEGASRASQPVAYLWNTASFPSADSASACPATQDAWGERTLNKIHEIRVLAKDDIDGSERSKTFAIALSNAPEAPEWSSLPRVIGDGTKAPRVEVSWDRQPKDGIYEYHVVRDGPGGTVGFAVKESNPGGQGCTATSSTITCTDDDFPTSYGGEYAYTVYAARTTSATSGSNVFRCEFGSGNCIRSSSSGAEFAELTEPEARPTRVAAEPEPDPTPSVRSSATRRATQSAGPTRSTTDYSEFYTGSFDESLPFERREDLTSSGGRVYGGIEGDLALGASQPFLPDDRDPTPYRALAGGLLMVLVAAHMARHLRRSNA